MNQQILLALLVGIGGAVGSISRYGVTLVVQRLVLGWPAGTLVVNVLGCFVIGVVAFFAERGGISPQVRLTLAAGFCGGFTTMSSMIYETAGLLKSGGYGSAFGYVGGTIALSLVAFIAGGTLLRIIIK